MTAAFDPNFAEVYEKHNAARLNRGVGLCKYTGARGKSGASDASAEVVGYVRKLFNDNGILWQLSEMGKVDVGGGGTVALYMANRNIDTIDAGIAGAGHALALRGDRKVGLLYDLPEYESSVRGLNANLTETKRRRPI